MMVRVLVVMGIVDPIHVKGLMLKVKLGTHVSTLRGFYPGSAYWHIVMIPGRYPHTYTGVPS